MARGGFSRFFWIFFDTLRHFSMGPGGPKTRALFGPFFQGPGAKGLGPGARGQGPGAKGQGPGAVPEFEEIGVTPVRHTRFL